jgi:hypothetical protein
MSQDNIFGICTILTLLAFALILWFAVDIYLSARNRDFRDPGDINGDCREKGNEID